MRNQIFGNSYFGRRGRIKYVSASGSFTKRSVSGFHCSLRPNSLAILARWHTEMERCPISTSALGFSRVLMHSRKFRDMGLRRPSRTLPFLGHGRLRRVLHEILGVRRELVSIDLDLAVVPDEDGAPHRAPLLARNGPAYRRRSASTPYRWDLASLAGFRPDQTRSCRGPTGSGRRRGRPSWSSRRPE